MILKDGKIYYKLGRVAEGSPYSADYLRVRILQKKLKGIKVGREWYTNHDWLNEYIFNFASKHKSARLVSSAGIRPELQVSSVATPTAPVRHFSDAIKAVEAEIGEFDLRSKGEAAVSGSLNLLTNLPKKLLFAAATIFLLSSFVYVSAHFPLSFYVATGKASEYLFGVGAAGLNRFSELAGLEPRETKMAATQLLQNSAMAFVDAKDGFVTMIAEGVSLFGDFSISSFYSSVERLLLHF